MLSSFRDDKHEFCLVVINIYKCLCLCVMCRYMNIDVYAYLGSLYQIVRVMPMTQMLKCSLVMWLHLTSTCLCRLM